MQCWLKTAIQKNCWKAFFTLSVRVIQEWDIMDIRRQSACLDLNLVTVYSYVFLFKCNYLEKDNYTCTSLQAVHHDHNHLKHSTNLILQTKITLKDTTECFIEAVENYATSKQHQLWIPLKNTSIQVRLSLIVPLILIRFARGLNQIPRRNDSNMSIVSDFRQRSG